MKILALSLILATGVGLHANAPAPDPIPVASYAPADTADSLWRSGRVAIADERWREAVNAFDRITARYPESAYAGDALYWKAFALQRLGGTSEVRRAVAALEQQRDRYPNSATFTSGESNTLMTRLNGRLARGGDAEAAVAIAEIAAEAAAMGVEAVAQVMPVVAADLQRLGPEIRAEMAAELERARPEIQRELAQARAELRDARRGRDDDISPECEGVIGSDRIEALNALMQMNAEQAMPILKRVLERRDQCSEILRRRAVFLVSQKRTPEAADILLNVARTDPDAKTRSEAVFWLSQTRDPRAAEFLEQILKDDDVDAEVRKRAIFALAQSRSERAGPVLREFIERGDVSEDERGDAIFWLGQLRGEDNSRYLRELFPRLQSDKLRGNILFAISQRRSEENARWLMTVARDRRYDGDIRKSALHWAGQAGVSVAALAEVYDNSPDDTELRGQVIFALSQRRNDSEALDKLVAIARTEENRELRRQALFWLGQSRDPRVAGILEEIINRPF